jgi:hypothetical protein
MTGESFAKAVATQAKSALSQRPKRTEAFAIGTLGFQLTAPIETTEWMGRAFPVGSEVDRLCMSHHLVAWDGTGAEAIPPEPPWHEDELKPLGLAACHSNENLRCAIDGPIVSLIVSDFSSGTSYTWYPSITALPGWAKASPFRVPLSWLCNRHQMQIVHAAAVGVEGRAVLLVGDGGSGKSTTALACALAGFDYLGDDYCAFEPATGKVHMVYRTAKMFRPTLDLLPAIADLVENRDRVDLEKGIAFLDPSHIKLARSANLSAILLPRVGDATGPIVHPASREQVIKAVLPSTVCGLMGGTSATPRFIMQLVQSVPAYHLILRPDMGAVVEAVAARSMAA